MADYLFSLNAMPFSEDRSLFSPIDQLSLSIDQLQMFVTLGTWQFYRIQVRIEQVLLALGCISNIRARKVSNSTCLLLCIFFKCSYVYNSSYHFKSVHFDFVSMQSFQSHHTLLETGIGGLGCAWYHLCSMFGCCCCGCTF